MFRNFNHITSAFALLALALAAGAQSATPTTPRPPNKPPYGLGDTAPAFQPVKWLKGEPVPKFERGHVYVIDFWATWCGPCKASMPHMSELARKYREKVTFIGVDVHEEKGTTMADVEKFVNDMGTNMDYTVAADGSKADAKDAVWKAWMTGFGLRGLPEAFVINQDGMVAWYGLATQVEPVLEKVLSSQWDLKLTADEFQQKTRLEKLDSNDVVNTVNPYMRAKDCKGALIKIDAILQEHPELRYYPKTGHFTFYCLLKNDPQKAVEYGQKWMAAPSDNPPYFDVVDAAQWSDDKTLPKDVYALAAECQSHLIQEYPWSFDNTAGYEKLAQLELLAGEPSKAVAAETKAIDKAKGNLQFLPNNMGNMELQLKIYGAAVAN